MENFNWLSFIIAGLVPSVIGIIWHQPAVFGKVMDKAQGPEAEAMQQGHKPYVHIVSMLLSFLIAFYLTYMVGHGGEEYATFKHGAFHGSTAAILFALPLVVVNYLYEEKKFIYVFLNSLYWFLCITIMGAIISGLA